MDSNLPLVSICCISYNHSKFLEQAIESFWAQTYKNIEILALDDGSKDNSYEILKELKEKSPCNMEVFQQENSGSIPKNFNFLLKKAKGKYVTIISLDDYLLPDAIEPQIDLMEKDNNIQFVVNTKFISFNSTDRKEENLNIDKLDNITAQDILDEDFNHIHAYCIQGSVYRKSLIEAVDYFDEEMIADDLVLRHRTAQYLTENPNYKIGVLRYPSVCYRKHENNVSKNISLQLKSTALFYQKYYPDKRNIRTLKNGFRTILKQHHFKDAINLYKEFPLYRDFTLLIPLWLISIFLKDILIFLKLAKKKY